MTELSKHTCCVGFLIGIFDSYLKFLLVKILLARWREGY